MDAKVIQQIYLAGSNYSLYLRGFDAENQTITFNARLGEPARTEKFVIDGKQVLIPGLHFPVAFLYNFLHLNHAIDEAGKATSVPIIYGSDEDEEEEDEV